MSYDTVVQILAIEQISTIAFQALHMAQSTLSRAVTFTQTRIDEGIINFATKTAIRNAFQIRLTRSLLKA